MTRSSPPLLQKIECIWNAKALLGEGPLFDPRCQALFWLDIKKALLHRLSLPAREKTSWQVPVAVSAIGLEKSGGYICARRDGFHFLSLLPSGELSFTPIYDPQAGQAHIRFNDGKVDGAGGFWAGTMDDAEDDDSAGNWWRLGPHGKVEQMDYGYHVTNGPAFDPSRARVYLTDSARQKIYKATFENGKMRGKQLFKQFGKGEGYPDGMTVDRQGYLWVCFWDGGCVRRLSPQGAIDQEIIMPVSRPTSICLAGPHAYITSAAIGLSPEVLQKAPLSGGLFKLTLSRPLFVDEPVFGAAPIADGFE